MASCIFPKLNHFLSFSASRNSLHPTPSPVLPFLSRTVSSKPKIAAPSHTSHTSHTSTALLCSATLNRNLHFPSPNELESEKTCSMSCEEEGVWSVIIPTYNRLPILTKCLEALEEQEGYEKSGVKEYEVVVVDDGSTDQTLEHLLSMEILPRPIPVHGLVQSSGVFPHVKVVQQEHGGATRARNLGVRHARGAVIVFIDSDLVVTKDFLREHGAALSEAQAEHGDDCTFTYGRVVNTANFENPTSEKFKITDNSAAFFATGNVALSRRLLLKGGSLLPSGCDGPFDADFSEYGWEDLELGVRLKQVGARIRPVPLAIGYHWHPAFSVDQIPKLIDRVRSFCISLNHCDVPHKFHAKFQERQRGRNGVRFFLKHPSLDVRLMTQLTPFHEALWFLLTLGGLLNEATLRPVLAFLVVAGHPGLAAGLLSPTLNWHTVMAGKEEVARLKREGKFARREKKKKKKA